MGPWKGRDGGAGGKRETLYGRRSFAEEDGAETDVGGALFDGDLEVGAHPHRQIGSESPVECSQCDAEFTQLTEPVACAFRVVLGRGNCHQASPADVLRCEHLAEETALAQAAKGRGMISMTPPDGLGYCECRRCLTVFDGAEPFREHRSLFARRADGALVNVTSETVFAMVNQIAAAVAEKHPETLVGCYAYSAYSHPPSFRFHPNVYLQTTTAFRRTPIPLAEQLGAFGEKTEQLGIREYYSVYQWDWDYPDPGKVVPSQLGEDLAFFHGKGITAVNAEAFSHVSVWPAGEEDPTTSNLPPAACVRDKRSSVLHAAVRQAVVSIFYHFHFQTQARAVW